CDIMMPVLDGYGVIHMLQKNKDTTNIPFIFLTAKAERAEIRKGMDLGADDYITKPFNSTELLNAVESRLKKADLLKKEIPADMNGVQTLISTATGKDLLKELTELRSTNTYKKKETIYSEGSRPYRLYYILSGKVKTFKTNDDGKEFVTNIYNEGSFFGYNALLENSLYKESAEALEETEVALVPKEDFESLVNNNRQVMMKFIQLLANNVTEKEQQLLKLAYNSLRKRVADTVLELYKKYKPEDPAKPFAIDISRENLANIVGTAKESVIRTLSDFKDEKMIDIVKGDIIVLNEKKLQNLLN
ncbi:MAG: cyclic nucleotide-binding domain-containing protein, partial [Taibaiella sp.]|nr:cyclic nucleotide-binding domain-containing protein [Taibaiella sp.]